MRTTLIASGIVILIVVILTFGYVLLFGAPQNASEVFTNFGIGGQNQFEQLQEGSSSTEETAGPAIASNTLRQLTTKPVAGMLFTGTTTAVYAEQGTGHLFEVSLDTGAEAQVSNTTFARVRAAAFAPDGTKVVLTYEEGGLTRNTLGTIGGGSLTTASLLSGARDFAWSSDSSELYYLVETANGTEGYAYDVAAGTSERLFTAPFGSLRATWGTDSYVYTKPAASLLGYAYRVNGSSLEPVTYGRFGLMATPFDRGVVITETANGELRSTAFVDGEEYEVPLALFPEKCTEGAPALGDLVCGGPLEIADGTQPDDWYKGVAVMSDFLWSVDIATGEATLLANPNEETGRVLDVEKIVSNGAGNQFLIANKTNSTLWLFTP